MSGWGWGVRVPGVECFKAVACLESGLGAGVLYRTGELTVCEAGWPLPGPGRVRAQVRGRPGHRTGQDRTGVFPALPEPHPQPPSRVREDALTGAACTPSHNASSDTNIPH
ncbi:hypothetical protein GCM10010276_87370 [Streptomyces longisporus]|uniref:Uncharacterized protein n=1 Tax=Streptomyces longisporus TaxID=1948 RepID=A0ABN3NHZ0_STRLO